MAKLANKRIYIIKETASRERHTEKNTDLCSVRENKDTGAPNEDIVQNKST